MTSYIVQELALPGVLLITPRMFPDERGFFAESYNEAAFAAQGIGARFVQDNVSHSKKGVLRGLHYQRPPHAQAKLVRCAKGKIADVAADCDPASPTYGAHVLVELSGDTQQMLYVPGRYAHGFCVLSDEALVEYKVDAFYHPEAAGGARYDDPLLAVPWPVRDPLLSAQDRAWELLPQR